MPASKLVTILALLLVLLFSTTFLTRPAMSERSSNILLSPDPSSNLGGALRWLAANQSSTGSYGAYQEHLAAAAAYALWLNDSTSQRAALSYLWLATQLNSSSAWFWGAEADIPGAVLYSIASSHPAQGRLIRFTHSDRTPSASLL